MNIKNNNMSVLLMLKIYISIVINDKNADGYLNEWPTVLVNGTDFLRLEDSKYSIPKIEIGKLESFEVLINRMTDATDTLEYSIEYNASFFMEYSFKQVLLKLKPTFQGSN